MRLENNRFKITMRKPCYWYNTNNAITLFKVAKSCYIEF